MADEKITNLRVIERGPSLLDIPGQLRQLADAIAAGEHGEVTSATFIIHRPDDWPDIFGWGDQEGENHPIVQCELVKAWLINKKAKRQQ